jgi:hypothetical protein
MLKHVSQSCQDVSARRSIRHNSFSLDSRLGASAEFLDELVANESKSVSGGSMTSSRHHKHYHKAGSGPGKDDREFRSFCTTKTGNYSGLVTLPRNKPAASAAQINNTKAKELSDSCLSLPNFSNITAIKVYAQCLRPHLSYKTVIITRHTTSRQVVLGLLSRFRMKHRDPKLFYLTMEVNIGEVASRTIALEDTSCLADMISCNPWGTCRFRLQARQGGLIKVYDGDVRTDSVYKSIIISHDSSVSDTVDILEACYNLPSDVALRLYEVDVETGDMRLLDNSEKPLDVKDEWGKQGRKIFRIEKTKDKLKRSLKSRCNIINGNLELENNQNMATLANNPTAELFSRSTLVRNTYLRQSVRKKQFLTSMITAHHHRISNSSNELEAKSFSLSRFNLSDQIISESVEDTCSVEDSFSSESCVNTSTSTSTSSNCDEVGVVEETRSEGDLNCSTSGVSSLSCSSLDSLHGNEQSFYT